ncbi:GntR family transcriptional regulator [Streptomyces olivaceus]|uniref:GntR family transcriptional regulator n=1 Tax=Streptomyces olivaceus TaxID=47716 RepID=A0ABS7WEH2_STROV|nr:GntR family transcriptional regulator [Streptomyces olivaceus]MBZ6092648.1 GntR family transcriptional regulator [Streptomyces olivaceus]MBZ6099521.1 GntR family transcriptional regulator [Streptomyces olivaceus]MBZ6120598.1 GntR family transcriptional regulator [Streptomyces olivaceus]MBZ6155576.1 GntR family transcriptional regulator [Streptomyces olivaceus]MBZ6206112.1 GntR family transcriptional regulator [Streptomyces olivaceus]
MAQSNGRRTSRRDIYLRLRQLVLTLELAPGAALSENELAASLGVSRTPVRESLILLAQEGLVQVFPKIGSFVSRVDAAQVADAQFLREAVELASLEDLPEQLDPEIVEELRANLERQRRAGLDREEFFALDELFHRDLMRLSGHGNSWVAVAAAKGHLDRARRLGLHGHESPAVFADQHHEILAAITDGDTPGARARMRDHLRAVFNDIERIRARSPELFASDPATVPVRRSVVVWE